MSWKVAFIVIRMSEEVLKQELGATQTFTVDVKKGCKQRTLAKKMRKFQIKSIFGVATLCLQKSITDSTLELSF